ncbi:hypothetical protein B9Z42_14980 [Limnohabitans sp. B9-3]|nr:hypothetical protein B9Z42_14980 [Limnohabitans sp. B9-3]
MPCVVALKTNHRIVTFDTLRKLSVTQICSGFDDIPQTTDQTDQRQRVAWYQLIRWWFNFNSTTVAFNGIEPFL